MTTPISPPTGTGCSCECGKCVTCCEARYVATSFASVVTMVTGLSSTIRLRAFLATSDANFVVLEEDRVPFLGSVVVGELALFDGWGVYCIAKSKSPTTT